MFTSSRLGGNSIDGQGFWNIVATDDGFESLDTALKVEQVNNGWSLELLDHDSSPFLHRFIVPMAKRVVNVLISAHIKTLQQ